MQTFENNKNEKLFFKIVRNKVIWNYILNFIKNQSLDSMVFQLRISYSKLKELPTELYTNKKNLTFIKDILKSNSFNLPVSQDKQKQQHLVNLFNFIKKLNYNCQKDIEMFKIIYNNYFILMDDTTSDRDIINILIKPKNGFIKALYKELDLNGEDSQQKKGEKLDAFINRYKPSISIVDFLQIKSNFVQKEILFFINNLNFSNPAQCISYEFGYGETSKILNVPYKYLNFNSLKEFSLKQLSTFSNQFKKFSSKPSSNTQSLTDDERQLYKHLIENYHEYFYLLYLKKYKNQFFLPWDEKYEGIIVLYTLKTLSVTGLQFIFDNVKNYRIILDFSKYLDFNGNSKKRILKFLKLFCSPENKCFVSPNVFGISLTFDQIEIIINQFHGFLYLHSVQGHYMFLIYKPSIQLNSNRDDECWARYKWYLENMLFKYIKIPVILKISSFNEIRWVFKNKEMIDWVISNSKFYFPYYQPNSIRPLKFLNLELANYFHTRFLISTDHNHHNCDVGKFIYSNLYQESIENFDIATLEKIDLLNLKFNSDGFKYFKFKNLNCFNNLINYLIQTYFKSWDSDLFLFFTFKLIPWNYSNDEIYNLLSTKLMGQYILNGFKLFSNEIINWFLELICNFDLVNNDSMVIKIISKLIETIDNVDLIQEIINSNLNSVMTKHIKVTGYYLNKFKHGNDGLDNYDFFNSNVTNVINSLTEQIKFLISFKVIKFPVLLYQHLYKILLNIDGISLYEIKEINKLYQENEINNPIEAYHVINWLHLKSTKFTKYINLHLDEFYIFQNEPYLYHRNWSNESINSLNLKFQFDTLSFNQIHSAIYFRELYLILQSRKQIDNDYSELKTEFDLELGFLFSINEIQLFLEQIKNNPFKKFILNDIKLILLFKSFLKFIFIIDSIYLKQFIKLILKTFIEFSENGKNIIQSNFYESIINDAKSKDRNDIIEIFTKQFNKI